MQTGAVIYTQQLKNANMGFSHYWNLQQKQSLDDQRALPAWLCCPSCRSCLTAAERKDKAHKWITPVFLFISIVMKYSTRVGDHTCQMKTVPADMHTGFLSRCHACRAHPPSMNLRQQSLGKHEEGLPELFHSSSWDLRSKHLFSAAVLTMATQWRSGWCLKCAAELSRLHYNGLLTRFLTALRILVYQLPCCSLHFTHMENKCVFVSHEPYSGQIHSQFLVSVPPRRNGSGLFWQAGLFARRVCGGSQSAASPCAPRSHNHTDLENNCKCRAGHKRRDWGATETEERLLEEQSRTNEEQNLKALWDSFLWSLFVSLKRQTFSWCSETVTSTIRDALRGGWVCQCDAVFTGPNQLIINPQCL